MSDKLVHTPEEDVIIANLKETNVAQLCVLYSIARYHEKFKFAKFALEELVNKGFTKQDIFEFDTNFSNFYDALINSTTL